MTLQLAPAAIFALGYLGLVTKAQSWPRTSVKTLSVLLLAGAAVPVAPVLALALFLCALGDFFLSRVGERAFLSGLIAFAAGHLTYILLFLRLAPAVDWHWVHMLITLVMIGAAGVAARMILPHSGKLKPATGAYLAIILAMGLAAVYMREPLVILGAVLFMTSDFLLGLERFVWRTAYETPKAIPYAVWSLYWLAQASFFAAFVGLG